GPAELAQPPHVHPFQRRGLRGHPWPGRPGRADVAGGAGPGERSPLRRGGLAPSTGAVGRSAPAGLPGPGPDHRAGPSGGRRAHLLPGRVDPGADPEPARRAAVPGEHGAHQPRHGRDPVPVRSGLRDAVGRDRGVRSHGGDHAQSPARVHDAADPGLAAAAGGTMTAGSTSTFGGVRERVALVTGAGRGIGVNVTGTFLMARRVGQSMIERKSGGAVVNIASIYGMRAMDWRLYGVGQDIPRYDDSAYAVSKGAVLQLTRSLATSWAGF